MILPAGQRSWEPSKRMEIHTTCIKVWTRTGEETVFYETDRGFEFKKHMAEL